MARGSSLLAVCAALCLLAPLSASAWTSRQVGPIIACSSRQHLGAGMHVICRGGGFAPGSAKRQWRAQHVISEQQLHSAAARTQRESQ